MNKTKTRKVESVSPKQGEMQINFGNVEYSKIKLLNDISKTLHNIEELLRGGSK